MALSMVDWIIVAIYLTVIVGIGVSMRRRAGSGIEDFFISGRVPVRLNIWSASIKKSNLSAPGGEKSAKLPALLNWNPARYHLDGLPLSQEQFYSTVYSSPLADCLSDITEAVLSVLHWRLFPGFIYGKN